jgi:REP element-mobilizing transposase RayT
MPSKRPEFLPNHYYHIYNRGAHKHPLFREDDNYLFVIRKMKHYCQKLQLTMIAYCLMPNHYHFLVRQEADNPAGLLPQRVFNSYSKAYNKKYGHEGTLFTDHYHLKEIEETSHLLHLCRYIHGNPVKDGFVTHPSDWKYSNFNEYIGKRKGNLFDPEFLAENFLNVSDYYSFVMDDLMSRDLPKMLRKHLEFFEK